MCRRPCPAQSLPADSREPQPLRGNGGRGCGKGPGRPPASRTGVWRRAEPAGGGVSGRPPDPRRRVRAWGEPGARAGRRPAGSCPVTGPDSAKRRCGGSSLGWSSPAEVIMAAPRTRRPLARSLAGRSRRELDLSAAGVRRGRRAFSRSRAAPLTQVSRRPRPPARSSLGPSLFGAARCAA